MNSQPQYDRGYNFCEIQILRDEDWRDSVVLEQLTEEGEREDMDFSSLSRLDLYVRPTYDHTVLIKRLSSDLTVGGEILFSPMAPGRITFYVARGVVIADIPRGTWDHFLVATYADGTTKELWRGDLIVHPGRIA